MSTETKEQKKHNKRLDFELARECSPAYCPTCAEKQKSLDEARLTNDGLRQQRNDLHAENQDLLAALEDLVSQVETSEVRGNYQTISLGDAKTAIAKAKEPTA